MQDLKKAVAIVADNCGIDSRDAARVIGLFNTGRVDGVQVCEPSHDTITAILAGDVSAVPAACAVLGIEYKAPGDSSGDSVKDSVIKDSKPAEGGVVGGPAGSVNAPDSSIDKIPASSNKRNTSQNKKGKNLNTSQARETTPGGVNGPGVHNDIAPAVAAEVVQDDKNELPPGFGDRCCEWVEAFCNKHNLDITHLKAQQWRSACMYVGENIKASGVYRDRERERHEGGVIYSGVILEKLLMLWAYLCGIYNQAPLVPDYINFTGVSRGFFYDYDGRGLTSASVRLAQKAKQIEDGGLVSSVAGGGAGAVGGMFLLKTRHGYSETVTIQHTSSAAALGLSEVPQLEDLSKKSL